MFAAVGDAPGGSSQHTQRTRRHPMREQSLSRRSRNSNQGSAMWRMIRQKTLFTSGSARFGTRISVHLPRPFPRVKRISLHDAQITDEGLRTLGDLPQLRSGSTSGMRPITDAGLAHLVKLERLDGLNISRTKVTDAGMVHVGKMKSLTMLRMDGLKLTDKGLAQLKGLTNLWLFAAGGSDITDKGLEHIAAFKKLDLLGLDGTKVTDAGMKHIVGLSKLTRLSLQNTAITDTGAKELHALKGLTVLDLSGTKVTDRCMADLESALPHLVKPQREK